MRSLFPLFCVVCTAASCTDSSGRHGDPFPGGAQTGTAAATDPSTSGSTGDEFAETETDEVTSADESSSSDGSSTGTGPGDEPEIDPDDHLFAVNIVDVSAKADLDGFFLGTSDLSVATHAFLAEYPDEFDFILFVNPDPPEGSPAGQYIPVYSDAIPSIGVPAVDDRQHYGTSKALGVAEMLFFPGGTETESEIALGPALHEILHHWSMFLDPSFGFGLYGAEDYGSHWGATGTFGQHGGFDPETIRCANPAGAPPPCVPEADGRTRVTLDSFGPNANGGDGVGYSMLELYLMGLATADEVPSPIPILHGLEYEAFDDVLWEDEITYASMTEVSMEEIVALHGTRPPAVQTHFRAAFVVVSEAPADEETMRLVTAWAKQIGGIGVPPGWEDLSYSFEEATLGRATMDTHVVPVGQ